ncbi:(d)CMP kinase [Parapedobacter tibetensis]|uniref:(d)CMP kinase n=1 Tax=Parapedobacter tibetensis TaxID=2972951 RepID=UPI002157579E
MIRTNKIIAIDGYSSCGKSTLAKALATKLRYLYVDSGAMYRAVTLHLIRVARPIEDEEGIAEELENINLDFEVKSGENRIFLNGEDVSEEIRQMYVSDLVSEVSAIKAVRVAMVAQQQKLGKRLDIVMDGRDIGTTVFPDADLKIFMTADPKIRAERRYLELKNKGENITLEEVFENLAHRDYIDTTREESPLIRADDAIILDNTNLNEEEQLQFVLDRL